MRVAVSGQQQERQPTLVLDERLRQSCQGAPALPAAERPITSCVDGPRLARVFCVLACAVTCSHVSGLCSRHETAGPDGIRGSNSDHGLGVSLPHDVWQGSFDPSVDRHCHHAFSPSQRFRSRPCRPVRPARREAGSPLVASSPPRRCAPSCWPAPRRPVFWACRRAFWPATDRSWHSFR